MEALQEARDGIGAILDEEQANGSADEGLDEVMLEARAEREERKALAQAGKKYSGLDCGFEGINDKTNGVLPGILTVVGADQSVGKTTYLCQTAHSVLKGGGAVSFVTQEEPRKEIFRRFVRIEAGDLDPVRFEKGTLSPEEDEAARQAEERVNQMRLRIYDRCRRFSQIEQEMRSGSRKWHVDMWAIDHLHRTSGEGENRHHELRGIVKGCKDLSLGAQYQRPPWGPTVSGEGPERPEATAGRSAGVRVNRGGGGQCHSSLPARSV